MIHFFALLGQLGIPETPKSGKLDEWFGWVVAVLCLLVVGIIGYLINTNSASKAEIKEAANEAKNANIRLVGAFEKVIADLQKWHSDDIADSEASRNAYLESVAKINENLQRLANKIDRTA